MKFKLVIPPKAYFERTRKILYGPVIDASNTSYTFNKLRQTCFNASEFQELLNSRGISETFAISSGISKQKAFVGFLNQISRGIRKNTYYREYSPTKGNTIARKAIALLENIKFAKSQYTQEDICFTTGSTGGITTLLEYIKKSDNNAEILIQTPNYYLYKYAATYLNLSFKEVLPKLEKQQPRFIDAETIVDSITQKTRLIIITNPANPSGEIYDKNSLQKILEIAKKQNILVLVDELFNELVFNTRVFTPADEIATKIGALNNLVIVKGYSKNKNLAAFRIGYLLTKNKQVLDAVTKIGEIRFCFPSASNYTGFICLDAFFQILELKRLNSAGKNVTNRTFNSIKSSFNFSETIARKTTGELQILYKAYRQYKQSLMTEYSDLYDIASMLLKNEVSYVFPKSTAFNTFFKLRGMEDINMFDFTLNLFLTTGVKIELAPCFGLTQTEWQKYKELGCWLRITFACSKEELSEGIKRFILFKKMYLKNQNKFLQTNIVL